MWQKYINFGICKKKNAFFENFFGIMHYFCRVDFEINHKTYSI